MNCQSCNTRIDYLFETNCSQCGCAVEPSGLTPNSTPDIQPPNTHSWKRVIGNLAYLLASSVAGMISGAVLVYVGAAIVFNAIYSGVDENPSVACARGSAIAFLSIVVGAFLGTILGSALAIKRPLLKTPVH
jgi:hypothetical protein